VDYYKIVIPSNAKAAIRFGHKRIDDDNKLWRVTLLENSGEEVGKYESKGTSNGVITLGEEELAALQSRASRDTSLYKVTDVTQLNTLRLITFIIVFVILPLLLIALGVILNVKRQK
jgi:hypothetical protein